MLMLVGLEGESFLLLPSPFLLFFPVLLFLGFFCEVVSYRITEFFLFFASRASLYHGPVVRISVAICLVEGYLIRFRDEESPKYHVFLIIREVGMPCDGDIVERYAYRVSEHHGMSDRRIVRSEYEQERKHVKFSQVSYFCLVKP